MKGTDLEADRAVAVEDNYRLDTRKVLGQKAGLLHLVGIVHLGRSRGTLADLALVDQSDKRQVVLPDSY